MAEATRYLALDLGAESGRGVLGTLRDGKLELQELHRFPNGPVEVCGRLHWDALRIWSELKEAVGQASAAAGGSLTSLGVDTWGVDYGLLDRHGELLGNPYHYRDARTDGMMEAAFEKVSREEIFECTGIQFMKLNTLFQLVAARRQGSPALDVAERLLMMPDLINYFFTGEQVTEYSIATTTQFYDPRAGDWARDMLDRLDIPTGILGPIVPTGSVVGPLRAAVAEELDIAPITVVAPACHDTGSAVAAVPATGENHCYLSSGTWSLMGIELTEPLISPQILELNFTNEGGAENTIRFLKNIMGLWLVQESRRQWERDGASYGYDELTRLAEEAPPLAALVNPDDDLFLDPGDMPARIRDYCRDSGQPEPDSHGAVVRCALESLALRYRWVIDRLEEVRGAPIDVVHIVGGGSQNKLLNQLTADCTGRPVVAGPVEATAIGNILVQAVAVGHLGSLSEAREVVRRSFPVEEFQPDPQADWEAAFHRFESLLAGS